jgi:hypothetical protein
MSNQLDAKPGPRDKKQSKVFVLDTKSLVRCSLNPDIEGLPTLSSQVG